MMQLHGGIAITWEHDAHRYFKRAHATAHLFGPLLSSSALSHRCGAATCSMALVGQVWRASGHGGTAHLSSGVMGPLALR